jgi:hypothetical protein
MRKSICILTSTILFFACGQSNQKKDSQVDTQAKVVFTKLDSIEKVNNERIVASGVYITKAIIYLNEGDSTINLIANIRQDHRIFGYAKPDIKSERLLLLSVFTDDVENNPFGCKLGAYYETAGMDKLTLKFISSNGNFVKAVAIDKTNKSTIIYFEKKVIEFS